MRILDGRAEELALTIVLAEDDADLRAIYSAALRLDGHQVHHAGDGGSALELLERVEPDLLLLDLWMPVLNGLEVLEILRRRGQTRFRTIVLSNYADADARLEGFALGAEDTWTKDLSLDELRRRVRSIWEDPAPAPGDPAALGPIV